MSTTKRTESTGAKEYDNFERLLKAVLAVNPKELKKPKKKKKKRKPNS